jgi:hypothetical protein
MDRVIQTYPSLSVLLESRRETERTPGLGGVISELSSQEHNRTDQRERLFGEQDG